MKDNEIKLQKSLSETAEKSKRYANKACYRLDNAFGLFRKLNKELDELEKKLDSIKEKMSQLGQPEQEEANGKVDFDIKRQLEKQVELLSKLSEENTMTAQERLSIALAIKDIAIWLK